MFTVETSDFDAGIEQIDDKLTRVGKVASDANPLWPKVGEAFAEFQREVFASGHNWAPLERTTILKKGSAQVLVERGVLMQAATSPTPVEANAVFAKFGVRHGDVPYAHWHARGAGVPERRPVPNLSPAAVQDILRIVADRVREEWSR